MSMSANVNHQPRHHHAAPYRDAGGPFWLSAAAGLCASLVGLGLARFAYTPLIPALIAAKWFTPAEAVYLGAANLAGYLAGALIAGDLGARIGSVWALRGMMVLAAITCFACAVPISFVWFFGFRFLAGVSGGVIMVLAATAILPHTAPSKRGLIGGVIFAGVGLGVAASGTLVPLLLQQGVKQAWYGLGVLSAVLTLISWRAWPAEAPAARGVVEQPVASHGLRSPLVIALCLEYGLNALALVPHMVFLVDFVARGLGQGIAAGSHYWVLYGIGAVIGPLLTGHLADRAGFAAALRAAFLIEAVAVALPAVTNSPAALIASSLIVGGFTPGIVPLVIGRIHELIPHSAASQRSAWAQATTTFALFQAAGAYGLSWLFARSGGDYALLFAIGAAGVVVALAIELFGVVGLRHKSG
ncbi:MULTISPECIES: YbfB/YjiJ family MFS transporter [unclassified Bradyrhizobium]